MAYEWLRAGGYTMAKAADDGREATHLFLDGGKAAVPDDVNGTFLNAYAAAVVRAPPHQRPCIVELRTPVFRMFMDMDACFSATADDTDVVTRATLVLLHVARLAREAFEEPAADVMEVCVASERKGCGDGGFKQGFHVVWPDVYAAPATALAFRQKLLETPLPDPWPFTNDPEKVFDASVFRSNGLRMPWSNKGRGDTSHYIPRASLVWDGEDVVLRRHAEPAGVADVRAHVARLCIRAFDRPETRVAEDIHRRTAEEAGPAGGSGSGARPSCANLRRYAHVLPALDAALPVQYTGQHFTGLVEGESCFMLRSSSRWCGNLKKGSHSSNNVYFVLSRKGIHQRCYCRCETTEGRFYGMCKDYCGPTHPVPPEVIEAFFGDDAAAAGGADATLTSAAAAEAAKPKPPKPTRHVSIPAKTIDAGLSTILGRRIEKKHGGARRKRT